METVVVEVLRTPEIQRLRRIRQLGLVHLVFPGAEHSRLVHSLGAAHLAVRFGRQLRSIADEHIVPVLCPDESVVRDLAVAALCHDLGHGPLSHAWEREVIGHAFDSKKWMVALGLDPTEDALSSLKWHELVAQGLLSWKDGQLHNLLEQHEEGASTRIRQLLGGYYPDPYVPRLLSSDIDVDRADFLRRDTHQTGVAYGRYDLDWLISTLTLGQINATGDPHWVIGFDDRKAVRVIEQFIIARQALYETVYHHKTVRCAEGMVALLLRRLRYVVGQGVQVTQGDIVRPIVRMLRGETVEINDLLSLDDFALSVLIDAVAHGNVKDDIAIDLAKRVVARDLFKWVPLESEKVRDFLERGDSRERLYHAVRPFCPGDPRYYIIEDTAKFGMMSSDTGSKAYLVSEAGSAYPAHEHEALRAYQRVETNRRRLFTIREAVEAVARVVNTKP